MLYAIKNRGRFIAEQTLDPYVVYVGIDDIPDFTQPPTTTSATLPISVPLTPPPSGTRKFYITTRLRNKSGLETAMQWYTIIEINSAGDEVQGPITSPSDISVFERQGQLIRVLAEYMAFNTDTDPATHWRIYAKEGSAPVVGVDPVDTQVAVSNQHLLKEIGPKTIGTWYILVTLFRDTDSAESSGILDSTEIASLIGAPTPVPGGSQVP